MISGLSQARTGMGGNPAFNFATFRKPGDPHNLLINQVFVNYSFLRVIPHIGSQPILGILYPIHKSRPSKYKSRDRRDATSIQIQKTSR
jgi:hypothetical protein